MDRAAIGVGKTKAHVVQQDDEDVRRVLGQMVRLHAPMHRRVLQSRLGDAGRRRRREWENGTVVRGGRRRALRNDKREGWREKGPGEAPNYD